MAKVLSICAILLANVVAHNYVLTPVDRGGNAGGGSTASPCPPGPQPTPWMQVRTGTPIAVTWTTNHGPPSFILNVLNDDYSATGTTATFAYPAASGSISFDATANPGHKIVQFQWANFVSCFDVTALATLPGSVPCDSTQTCGDNVVSLPSHDGTYDEITGTLTCKDGCKPNAAKTDCSCGVSLAGKGIGGFNPFSLAVVIVACAGIPVLALAMVVKTYRTQHGPVASASTVEAPAKSAAPAKAATKAAPAAAATTAASAGAFKAGESVNALFKAENKWYPAKIIKSKGPGMYVVQFNGFPEHHDLKENMIAAM